MRVPIALSVVGSLAVFLAIAFGLVWATNRAAEDEALSEAGSAGELAARVSLSPFLTPGLLRGDSDAKAALDERVQSFITFGDVVRLKVWSRDQRIIWSDEEDLIGQQFRLEDDEFALFDSGGSIVHVSDLNKEENAEEIDDGNSKLLEVYISAKTTDGETVLVESYFHYSMVTDRQADLRRTYMPLIIGGLALLTLAQVPLTILLARRLSRSQRERERLLGRVIRASDAERRRIAAEVHDGAVQDLIGITYSLDATADSAPQHIQERLHTLAGSTRTTVRQLRSVLNSIYPVEVPADGWEHGLSDLVDALEAEGVEVTVDIEHTKLAPMDELLVLRVTRESLRNIAAHADAEHVTVRFRHHFGSLHLEVRDDGRGFTDEAAAGSRSEGHLGLQLIRDLADDVGADLTIDSVPGDGTSVRLELVGQR